MKNKNIQVTCVDLTKAVTLYFLFRANKVAHWVPPLHRCEYK